jgi:fructoselysine 6-kinase
MTARFDLVAVGDNCIDRFSGLVENVLVGGNAVNVAVQAAKSGLRTAYAGAVGPKGEENGDRVVAALAANGVDTRWLERTNIPTSVTELRVEPDGDRRILHEDFGACAGWSPSLSVLDALQGARHVHIGWLNDGGTARRALTEGGISTSQDISVNALSPNDIVVDGLQVAFASLSEDLADQAEALASTLVTKGARTAVVTLGRRGSLTLVEGCIYRAKAHPVQATDTTGAGDSYIAGYLAARLSGKSVPQAMATGHARAAQTCIHPGGFQQ